MAIPPIPPPVPSSSGSSLNANPASQYGALPFVYNGSPLLLPKWRAALAKQIVGTANSSIVLLGDSTTLSFYSNGLATGNFHTNAIHTLLAGMFNSAGIKASSDNFMGSGGTAIDQQTAFTGGLISAGSGWSAPSSYTAGGSFYRSTAATSNFAFTPIANVDTFVICYAKGAGFGTFNYNFNGGANTQIATANASNAFGTTTVTTTLGANTLNLNWVSGTVNIIGIYAYNSANKVCNIINAGWGGSTTGNSWGNSVGNPYSPTGAVANLNANLIIANLGINDWAATSAATWQTQMQTVITNVAGTADILLVTPYPSATSIASVALQQAYISAYYALAKSNNVPLIDFWSRTVSNAQSVTVGTNYDTKHPNGAGYADYARALYNLIGTI